MKSAWIVLLSFAALPAQADSPPNIVLLYADDLGYGDLGCYGNALHETPVIDQLAAEGLRFSDAYANAPNCAPSRAALMSGQYAPRTGVYTVNSSARGKSKHRMLIPIENRPDLEGDVLTIAEVLQGAGYATAHVGKWHLGADPTEQGFDVNRGGSRAGHPKSYHSPYKNVPLDEGPQGEYLTDRLAQEACAFIAEHAEEPFFLYLSFYSVHTPIQGREDLVEHYRAKGLEGKAAGFAAMVGAVDEAVGCVLGCLEELQLEENTLVLFYSDNGGHGRHSDMGPLRGAKGMLHEGGIRVPLIARWPGRVAPGTTSAAPVIGVDLFPTFAELARAAVPEEKVLDGESLVPLLTNGDAPRREALYWHFPAYLEGSTQEQGRWRATPGGVIRCGDWKLIENFENGRLDLYDLARDVGETRDLAATQTKRALELLARLRRWRASIGAPVPTERNPEYEGR